MVRLDIERTPARGKLFGADRWSPSLWLGEGAGSDSDGGGGRRWPQQPQDQGSGLVVDGARGMLVTNAHVVRGASRVRVTLADGRCYAGEVHAVDELSDLAVVRKRNTAPTLCRVVWSSPDADDTTRALVQVGARWTWTLGPSLSTSDCVPPRHVTWSAHAFADI